MLACEREGLKAVVVGGGVSANSKLRMLLREEADQRGLKLFIPPFALTTDNAAMIARLGFSLYKRGIRSDFRMMAYPNLNIGGNGHEPFA